MSGISSQQKSHTDEEQNFVVGNIYGPNEDNF